MDEKPVRDLEDEGEDGYDSEDEMESSRPSLRERFRSLRPASRPARFYIQAVVSCLLLAVALLYTRESRLLCPRPREPAATYKCVCVNDARDAAAAVINATAVTTAANASFANNTGVMFLVDEYGSLVGSYEHLRLLLEPTGRAAALPALLRHSSDAIRNVHGIVSRSSLASRQELLEELDDYAGAMGCAASALEYLLERVDTTADRVLETSAMALEGLQGTMLEETCLAESPLAGASGAQAAAVSRDMSAYAMAQRCLHHATGVEMAARLLAVATPPLRTWLDGLEARHAMIYELATAQNETLAARLVEGRHALVPGGLWWALGGREALDYHLLRRLDAQIDAVRDYVDLVVRRVDGMKAALADLKRSPALRHPLDAADATMVGGVADAISVHMDIVLGGEWPLQLGRDDARAAREQVLTALQAQEKMWKEHPRRWNYEAREWVDVEPEELEARLQDT